VAGNRGFFGSLFDFSFRSFVFPKLVSFLYFVLFALLTLCAAGIIAGAFLGYASEYEVSPWIVLAVTPFVYLLYLVILRMGLETAIVLFRIYENTTRIAERSQDQGQG